MSDVELNVIELLESVIDSKIQSALKSYDDSKKTYRGVKVLSIGKDGTIWVQFPGGAEQTPVNNTLVDVRPDDIVMATIENGIVTIDGNQSNYALSQISHDESVKSKINVALAPVVESVKDLELQTLKVDYLRADVADMKQANIERAHIVDGQIDTLVSNSVTVNQKLTAAEAKIAAIESDYITTAILNAQKARIDTIESDYVTTDELDAEKARIGTIEANYATIANLNAQKARIDTIESNYVTTAVLNADIATINNLIAGKASVADLNAATADIDDLKATKADISLLESDYIKAAVIEANYAKTDFSNATAAWIQNGVIKNGAITNAMINDVSADKLTAGTIDASKINVTNLQAKNISVEKINGVSVSGKSIADALTQHESDISDLDSKIDDEVDALNDRIDGAIETFTGTAVPTLNNSPASSWKVSGDTTATNKNYAAHVGDVYYVVNDQIPQNGYCYRFTYINNAYQWQLIKDSDVTAALQRLQQAEGDIDGLETRTATIEQFDEEIATFKTETESELSTLMTKTTTLETRIGNAESDLSTKVETSVFNETKQTVEENSNAITTLNTTTQQLRTDVNGKASQSDLTSLTATVNTVKQTADTNKASITSLNTTTQTLREDLDGLEIGGRNLVKWTAKPVYSWTAWDSDPSASTGWGRWSANWTIVDTDEGIKGTSSSTSPSGFAIPLVRENAVVGGEEYVLSFDYRTNRTSFGDIYLLCASGGNVLVHSNVVTAFTSEWKHYEQVITWPSTANKTTRALLVPYFGTVNDWFEIRNSSMKLEKGNRATDWTPAPEDTEASITEIRTTTTNKFNEVEQTLDGIETSIGEIQNDLTEKADGSTVSTLTSRVNTISDTVDGHTQTIQSVQETVATKADGSTVSSLSTKVNNIEDTVDGHTSQITHVTRTANAQGTGTVDYSVMGIWEQGTTSNEAVGKTYDQMKANNATRIRFESMTPITAGTYKVTIASGFQFLYETFDEDGKMVGISSWKSTSEFDLPISSSEKYIVFLLRKGTGSANILPEEAEDSKLRITYEYASDSEFQETKTDYATFKQTVNQFQSTVGTTYATKSELSQASSASEITKNAEGQREITTTDAAPLPLITLTAYGESVQNGTPTPDAPVYIEAVRGRNLLTKSQTQPSAWTHSIADTTEMTGTSENLRWEMVKTGGFEHCYIEVLVQKGQTYTLSVEYQILKAFDLWNTSFDFGLHVDNAQPGGGNDNTIRIASIPMGHALMASPKIGYCTFTPTTDSIWINIPGGYVKDGSTNVPVTFSNMQLEIGSKMTRYSEQGSLGVVAHGKNVLPLPSWDEIIKYSQTSSYYNYPLRLKPGIAYHLNTQWTNAALAKQCGYILVSNSVNNTAWLSIAHTSSGYSNNNIAVPADGILYLNVYASQEQYEQMLANAKPQLEEGTVATSYEPYWEHVSHLDLKGYELHGLDDTYRDQLDILADGIVQLTKRTIKFVFDGSEAWANHDAGSTTNNRYALKDASLYPYPPVTGLMKTSNFAYNNASTTWGKVTERPDGWRIIWDIGNTHTLSSFKSWLSSNPVTWISPLSELEWYTVSLGKIDLPQVDDGSVVHVAAEVQPYIDASWWTKAGYSVGRLAQQSKTDIIQTNEQITISAASTLDAAKTYTDGEIATEVENRTAAISTKADEIASTVESSYAKTQSRGEQLVTNGAATLGDNTNFSLWIYDGSMANGSGGSFTRSAGPSVVVTNEFIPVDQSQVYEVSFDAVSANGDARLYCCAMCYDVDGNNIDSDKVLFIAGSTTTLAQDLKAGDTYVYLTDVSGFDRGPDGTNVNQAYSRKIIFWDWTNSFGYTYPEETYSRHLTSINLWESHSDIDYTNNRIKLRVAWSGSTVPAGTKLSQGNSGGTYLYIAASNALIPTTWKKYIGYIGPNGVTLPNVTGAVNVRFRAGTAKVKIGYLWNYGMSASAIQSQIWITNVAMRLGVATTMELESARSEIKQTTDNISVEVSKKVGNNEIISRINQSPEAITIDADRIKISGTTVFGTDSTLSTYLGNNYDAKGAAQAAVDNLEIGGRNLLLGTSEPFTLTAGYLPLYTISDIVPTLATNDDFTISFLAKASANRYIDLYWVNTAADTGGTSYNNTNNFYPVFQLTTDWARYTYTGKAGTNVANAKALRLRQSSSSHGNSATGQTVYVKEVMLEKATKPSAWQPAPEDTDAAIDAVDTKADNAQTAADNASAVVDVYPTTVDYVKGTATLAVRLTVNGVAKDITSYVWTKGPSQTAISGATGATLNVTDLNDIYNCKVTW